MSDVKGGKFLDKFAFMRKLKSIKGIEWIIVGIACLLLFLIYFSNFSSTDKDKTSIEKTYSAQEYASQIEDKLSSVLSNVEGAGKVSVIVTLKSGYEFVYATNKEEKTNTTSGATNSTQTVTITEKPIIVSNQPIILMEILPKVNGILVVAKGANNVKVKLNLLKAVQAVIDVSSENIEIIAGG